MTKKSLYVYLNIKERKILISHNEINSEYFELLMNVEINTGQDAEVLSRVKLFCIGYVLGSRAGMYITNDLNEFTV